MRLEFINRVKENDILGKSILTNEGQVLLRAGVKLNNVYIQKLKELGVFYIYINDDRLGDIDVEDTKLSELKRVTMRSISNIMRNVHSCTGKKLKESLRAVEDMISYIIDLGDVNKSLNDIQTYDNYTYVHSLDTCIMAAFLGISSRFNGWDIRELGIGAILHDIGKTQVPIKILNKKGRLSEEEFNEIKKHAVYGAEMLKKNLSMSSSIIKIVEQHHERIDGKGYPYGLSGNQISKYAKIVCICDVYDAISNDRCYRQKFNPNDAYELILSGSGTNFDEEFVKGFKNTFAIFPLGCCVKLSNGEEGYIIRQNKGFPDRPVIRILYDSMTKEPVPFYEINLLSHPNVVIKNIV
ncbi:HD-GYP domain-containing protein [Clostridiaceae bacterium UIB06]|uniref:HD-GYP domain-containing protein n=1 Tax=Clostridium thailandense TaxID=2794346 RepID=A0A949U1Y4_9CLOT|nr:HD-GYP domain-containing protein [Clostridium thailandense]MBV7274993.1 HD-GYP domain-containing protein [Clostridium thailandense]MCH5137912.1 HD-GYP domain-containing protein [Clostridiaceae bacterium UIB06]